MKSSRILLLFIVLGCNLPPDLGPVYFFGDDTAVCVGARPVSFTADLVFEVDIMLLSGTSRDYTLEYVEAKDISFSGPGQYVVQSITKEIVPLRLPGAVGILVDQHGSYLSIDSGNFRSKQVNQFIHGLSTSDSYLLGGFASGGLLNNVPVEYATSTFVTDPDVALPFLFGLSKRTGGVSDLYDATAAIISQFSAGSNRNLVLLVHGHDSVSAANINAVISSAVAQSVKVDVVFMGSPDDALALVPLAVGTGGIFVSCPSDGNMVTAINHLNNIYTGQPTLMRVKVQYTPPAPLMTGDDTFHQLVIHDSLRNVDLNIIPIYIKVP